MAAFMLPLRTRFFRPAGGCNAASPGCAPMARLIRVSTRQPDSTPLARSHRSPCRATGACLAWHLCLPRRVARPELARLNADGTLDRTFQPDPALRDSESQPVQLADGR